MKDLTEDGVSEENDFCSDETVQCVGACSLVVVVVVVVMRR